MFVCVHCLWKTTLSIFLAVLNEMLFIKKSLRDNTLGDSIWGLNITYMDTIQPKNLSLWAWANYIYDISNNESLTINFSALLFCHLIHHIIHFFFFPLYFLSIFYLNKLNIDNINCSVHQLKFIFFFKINYFVKLNYLNSLYALSSTSKKGPKILGHKSITQLKL